MERRRKADAGKQLVAVLTGLAVIAGAAVVAVRRPAGAAALAAEVAILRSQASEAMLLHDLWSTLPGRFADAHARQLVEVAEDERKTIASMHVDASLADAAAAARAAATSVSARAQELADDAPRFDRARARATVELLAALERALRH